jgi:hypothetical protein
MVEEDVKVFWPGAALLASGARLYVSYLPLQCKLISCFFPSLLSQLSHLNLANLEIHPRCRHIICLILQRIKLAVQFTHQ